MVEGNYGKVQERVLARADTVIWLDYSFGTKWRLFWRTCHRAFGNETLWNGNTERVRKAFFSRQSIFLWFFETHWRQRRSYESLFADAPPNLTLYRLYAPGEAERLLSKLPSTDPDIDLEPDHKTRGRNPSSNEP